MARSEKMQNLIDKTMKRKQINFKIGCWMTVYNRSDLLIDTTTSILKCKDLTGLKFVICDDGSTNKKIEPILYDFMQKLKARDNEVVLIEHDINYGKPRYDETLKECFYELRDCQFQMPIPADFLFSQYLFQAAKKSTSYINDKVKVITFFKESRNLKNETKVINDYFIETTLIDWVPGVFDSQFVKEFIPGMVNLNARAGTGTTHTMTKTAKQQGYIFYKYKESLCDHIGNGESALNPEYRQELELKAEDVNLDTTPDILIEPVETLQERKPAIDDNSLLICTGNGMGNALETLSLCQAGYKAGRIVDVLIHCNNYTNNQDVVEFLKKTSCINNAFTLDEYNESDKKYNMVLFLWGGSPVTNQLDLKGQPYIKLPHFVDFKNEIETNYLYSNYFDFKGPVPFDWKVDIKANNKYKDFIAIHIGCNPQKFWRDKRVWPGFNDLFKKLKKEKIVIVGSEQDADIPVELTSNCMDLRSDGLSLIETAEVLRACKYLITCDSGVMQLSNVLKVKAFSLWGGTAWTRSLPKNKWSIPIILRLDCQPCQFNDKWKTCDRAICLQKLTAQNVIDVIKDNKKDKPILVILCTYKRNAMMKKSLDDMIKKAKSPLKIFIYDDCNNTPFKYTRKNVFMHYAKERIKNSGARKTLMIEMALERFPDCEWLYLTDDDFLYSDGWDRQLKDIYDSEQGIGLATGFNHPIEYEKNKQNGDNEFYYPKAVIGGSMFTRADVIYDIMNNGEFWNRMQGHHGMFDFHLSNEIRAREYKIKSPVKSFVFHNPWGKPSTLHGDNRHTVGVDGDVLPITVITIVCNDFDYLKGCVESINENQIAELILISNGKENHDKVRNFSSNKFLRIDKLFNDDNIGFTKAMNVAMRKATQETLLWMSPDIILPKENTLKRVFTDLWTVEKAGIASCYHLREPINVHFAGGKWLKPENEIYEKMDSGNLGEQEKEISIHNTDVDISFNNGEVKETRWITGGFLMMKKDTLKSIGYMDDRYFFFRSDSTYCLKAWRKGIKCILSPIHIIHFVAKSGYPFPKGAKLK